MGGHEGVCAREHGQTVHYYLDTGGKQRKEIPLGSDYVLAVQKWSELTSHTAPANGQITMGYVVQQYLAKVAPRKTPNSRRSDEQERTWVLCFFDDPPAPLESIQPQHIRQYMRWRAEQARSAAIERAAAAAKKQSVACAQVPEQFGQVRANRSKALLSHMWNFAREEGITAPPNPCTGVHRFREVGRETAPDSEMIDKVLRCANRPLQFAMRLAELTGQRPGDVRKITEADIKDGILHVRQGKTSARLRVEVVGELANLLDEIRMFKRDIGGVRALALLVNQAGQPLRADAIRYRFDKAREAAGIPKRESSSATSARRPPPTPTTRPARGLHSRCSDTPPRP